MATIKDYSINGAETARAFEDGLVSAEWYKPPVPRERLKALMKRSNFPALWHALLWFSLIAASGAVAYLVWPTWWAVPAFFVYSTILVGSADARWHECGHRTAFKTEWLNNAIYHFAAFNLLREPATWRWSHTRHPHRQHHRWPRHRNSDASAAQLRAAVLAPVQPPSVEPQGRAGNVTEYLHARARQEDLPRERLCSGIRVAKGVPGGAGVDCAVGGP